VETNRIKNNNSSFYSRELIIFCKNKNKKEQKVYSRTAMLTYYQVSRPRKIKVRVVKAHDHVPYLGSGNVVDTRQKTKIGGFGATFFTNRYEQQLSEYDKWQSLSRKLKKQLV
jgi:hypothetical protein